MAPGEGQEIDKHTSEGNAKTPGRSIGLARNGRAHVGAPEAGKRRVKAGQAEGATLAFEARGREAGHAIIAGVDEAGRGPWAGPVVAAAVVLDPDNVPIGIADSKKLKEAQREVLFEEIYAAARVGIAFADAERIDRDNILAATLWAMQQAVAELDCEPSLVLIDGNKAPTLDCATQTIVKGDALSLSIAAASIVAKVSRDRMMKRLDVQYPGYGFAQHKGYGTAQHSEALLRLGATAQHRRSFKPVQLAMASTGGRNKET